MDPIQQSGQPVRFIADAMLGRLAHWLRILGYDTAYEKFIDDDLLIERALRENRWLLTRDSRLARRKILRNRHTLIASDSLDDQLRQLRQELSIDLEAKQPRRYRCVDCNAVLTPVPRDEAIPLVPPLVAHQHQTFLQCPECHRMFWPGTHWDGILNRLASMNGTVDRDPA